MPRLVFLMHEVHLVKAGEVETGEGAIKLAAFKERLKNEKIINRQSNAVPFHYLARIPTAPEAFIAHPYTLMQTHELVGRQEELSLLTDWIKGRELIKDGTNRRIPSPRDAAIEASC
jgi:hypothetical protein